MPKQGGPMKKPCRKRNDISGAEQVV